MMSGGDGLVAARHLHHYGYKPTIYYPKPGKNELYQVSFPSSPPPYLTDSPQRLQTQLQHLSVPFTTDFPLALQETDHIIDAIFGFSFSGEIREPFPSIIAALAETRIPVTSIDAPSSWDIENGPPTEGPGMGFEPDILVSLTAPKPLVKFFKGRHFVGGR